MLARVASATVHGIQGILVQVEVDLSAGLPCFLTVGLPDASVKESKNRVVAALRNSGYDFPNRKCTVNLAPAGVKKEGPAFELPMAIGVLAAANVVIEGRLEHHLLVGELALDGSLRPVKGVLPMAMEAKAKGFRGIVLPAANAQEAAVVRGLAVVPCSSLRQAVEFLNGRIEAPSLEPVAPVVSIQVGPGDFAEVKGQLFAKRALEIAAAGGHNVLLIGPPGSGKTMLAKRLAGILPPLTHEEAMEVTKIHSVAGHLLPGQSLIQTRPFRAPHHTASDIALIGGGQSPRPGEVSLAHNGVLFLDELPEFHRNVLEVLRQPLEDGSVRVARARESLTFPARFLLVAAMNPCPCGFAGHPERSCVCSEHLAQKYRARISGPLMDRLDLHVDVPALKVSELLEEPETASLRESSRDIARRAAHARTIQAERFHGSKQTAKTNAHMTTKDLKRFCALDKESKGFLAQAAEGLGLSARGFDRILKVARTVADLAGSETLTIDHLAEAVHYRSLDRLPAAV